MLPPVLPAAAPVAAAASAAAAADMMVSATTTPSAAAIAGAVVAAAARVMETMNATVLPSASATATSTPTPSSGSGGGGDDGNADPLTLVTEIGPVTAFAITIQVVVVAGSALALTGWVHERPRGAFARFCLFCILFSFFRLATVLAYTNDYYVISREPAVNDPDLPGWLFQWFAARIGVLTEEMVLLSVLEIWQRALVGSASVEAGLAIIRTLSGQVVLNVVVLAITTTLAVLNSPADGAAVFSAFDALYCAEMCGAIIYFAFMLHRLLRGMSGGGGGRFAQRYCRPCATAFGWMGTAVSNSVQLARPVASGARRRGFTLESGEVGASVSVGVGGGADGGIKPGGGGGDDDQLVSVMDATADRPLLRLALVATLLSGASGIRAGRAVYDAYLALSYQPPLKVAEEGGHGALFALYLLAVEAVPRLIILALMMREPYRSWALGVPLCRAVCRPCGCCRTSEEATAHSLNQMTESLLARGGGGGGWDDSDVGGGGGGGGGGVPTTGSSLRSIPLPLPPTAVAVGSPPMAARVGGVEVFSTSLGGSARRLPAAPVADGDTTDDDDDLSGAFGRGGGALSPGSHMMPSSYTSVSSGGGGLRPAGAPPPRHWVPARAVVVAHNSTVGMDRLASAGSSP